MNKIISLSFKIMALAIAAIEATGSFIAGIVLWTDSGDAVWGLLILLGPVFALATGLLFLGIGEIIDKLNILVENTRKDQYNDIANEICEQGKATEQINTNEANSAEVAASTEAPAYAEPARAESVTYFCPNCNNIIIEGDNFCTACGQKFNWKK